MGRMGPRPGQLELRNGRGLMDPLLNFIDGAFVPSAAGATLETVNPATGAVITTLPR